MICDKLGDTGLSCDKLGDTGASGIAARCRVDGDEGEARKFANSSVGIGFAAVGPAGRMDETVEPMVTDGAADAAVGAGARGPSTRGVIPDASAALAM